MQVTTCLLSTRERRGPPVQGAFRPWAPEAPGPPARPRRPDAERDLPAPGHDPPGSESAPGRARGREPHRGAVARAREAALPQPGTAARALRPLGPQVRAAAAQGPSRSETPARRARQGRRTFVTRSTFVYVIYIRTTLEKLWSALTDVEFMKQYWFGTYCESQWTAGSTWKHVSGDAQILDAGEIVETEPPRRLVIRWRNQNKPELKAEGESLCTMELEPSGTAVKLSITHSIEREPSKLIEAVSGGWPKVISNLKSLLETGSIALQDPYPTGNPYGRR